MKDEEQDDESDEQDDGSDFPEVNTESDDEETTTVSKNYLTKAAFPLLTGMAIPVWVFCPGIPLGIPVMALFPVLIYS